MQGCVACDIAHTETSGWRKRTISKVHRSRVRDMQRIHNVWTHGPRSDTASIDGTNTGAGRDVKTASSRRSMLCGEGLEGIARITLGMAKDEVYVESCGGHCAYWCESRCHV